MNGLVVLLARYITVVTISNGLLSCAFSSSLELDY